MWTHLVKEKIRIKVEQQLVLRLFLVINIKEQADSHFQRK